MAASNLLYSCPVLRVNRVFLKFLVPRRKFYSFYVHAAIDRDTMEWTTKFSRSKPCSHLLRYFSLAGFVCGFTELNPSVDYAGEDVENRA